MAAPGEQPDGNTTERLRAVESSLARWRPALAADPAQRVRNLLYVAGVADLTQLPIERDLPPMILERLLKEFPDRNELAQIFCWIALRPQEGEDSAIDQVGEVVGSTRTLSTQDKSEIRNRAYYYAVKLMNRALAPALNRGTVTTRFSVGGEPLAEGQVLQLTRDPRNQMSAQFDFSLGGRF